MYLFWWLTFVLIVLAVAGLVMTAIIRDGYGGNELPRSHRSWFDDMPRW